jgi:hypothetical protein
MVMKAARALCDQIFRGTGFDADAMWNEQREHYLCDANEILTACGALECLEALELLLNNVGKNSDYPGAQVARKAIAKVYESAPE